MSKLHLGFHDENLRQNKLFFPKNRQTPINLSLSSNMQDFPVINKLLITDVEYIKLYPCFKLLLTPTPDGILT